MVVLNVYIHEDNHNVFSSADFNGFKVFDCIEEAYEFVDKNDFKVINIQEDKELGLIYCTLEDYEYDYKLDMCKELFQREVPKIVESFWKNEEKKKNDKRKEEGYVLCKPYKDLRANDYIASLDKFISDDVRKYLDYTVFGYFGHNGRKHFMDKIFEEVCSKTTIKSDNLKDINIYQCVGDWMCSSNARHWLDSHEEDNEENFKKAVIKDIKSMVSYGASSLKSNYLVTYAQIEVEVA